jgi:hypothetical protein
MLSAKYRGIVFALCMSLLMSGVMSLVITILNLGLSPRVALPWLRAWLFSFVIAFPTIVLVSPAVNALVGCIVADEKPQPLE